MSKLTHVRKALQENPNITMIGENECNYLPGRYGFFSHTVDFLVAPTRGAVYDTNELQVLMMSLVPELKCTQKDDFRDYHDEIMFGVLYFDEEIGTEVTRREIVLTDPDMFACSDFVDGKRIIEHTYLLQRRTWVRLFPNTQIAALALEGKDKYRISKRELSESKRAFTRILNALSFS